MGQPELVLRGGDATVQAYRRFLGPDVDGTWSVANMRLRIGADVQNAVLFPVDDVEARRRLVARRGLALEPFGDGFRASDLPVGITPPSVAPSSDAPSSDAPTSDAYVDHVVFTAANRDHAVALFGATLDLDFRLEQPVPGAVGAEVAASQLFFRADDLIVEVVANPQAPEPIALWGLAWRVADVDATRSDLTDKGFEISEVRTGRKRGTRVCTVREPALAIPTLLIDHRPE